MAYQWGYRPEGIQYSRDSITLPFRLVGEWDAITARTIALTESPKMFGYYLRKDVTLRNMGGGVWDVDGEYGLAGKKEPEVGDYKWSFSTTGATKHITQAIQHMNTYVASGKTAIDHKGAIGVTDDTVEGVDVPDKGFSWTETHVLPLAGFGFIYSAILGQLNGRMNATYFRGFAAYTVRFDGATGGKSEQGDGLVEITYNFTFSPSESGLSLGGITGIAKHGWDYLWARYESEDDSTAKKTTLQPRQVEVERVLHPLDFSVFGIGTGILQA